MLVLGGVPMFVFFENLLISSHHLFTEFFSPFPDLHLLVFLLVLRRDDYEGRADSHEGRKSHEESNTKYTLAT